MTYVFTCQTCTCQGLVMSLAVGIQGQKAYGYGLLVVQLHDTASAGNASIIYHSLIEGVPSAVEACNLLVNFQRMTSSSLIYFHLKNPLCSVLLNTSMISALVLRASSVTSLVCLKCSSYSIPLSSSIILVALLWIFSKLSTSFW